MVHISKLYPMLIITNIFEEFLQFKFKLLSGNSALYKGEKLNLTGNP
jgi:hypothetical protein